MSDDRQDDDLLKRARDLQARLKDDDEPESRKRGILSGGTSVIGWVFRTAARYLRWLMIEPAEVAYERGRFSAWRFARNAAISLAVVVLAHMTLKAVYFYTFQFEETVYVTGKQEIETGELYQFGGCTSLPCSTNSDNGKFYLIESSLYFPTMLYPEEEVFANIPQQDAACNVEGYGIYFRTLRWIYKAAQLYQHVVNVSCRPYTEEEITRAVEEGEIVRDRDEPEVELVP